MRAALLWTIALAIALAYTGWYVASLDRVPEPDPPKMVLTLHGATHIDGTVGTNAVRQFIDLEFMDDQSVRWKLGEAVKR
jgi:hypothetical protein